MFIGGCFVRPVILGRGCKLQNWCI